MKTAEQSSWAFLFLLAVGWIFGGAILSATAEPQGHGAARAIVATGIWVNAGEVPAGFDPGFRRALRGWNVVKGGSAAACHFVVRPSGRYVVAIGFFDPQTKPGARLQDVVIDGRKVDTLDPAGRPPLVRLYDVADLNGDGYLQVSCSHAKDESGATGWMNVVWLFEGDQKGKIDPERLARGTNLVPPMCRFDAASADRAPREHVDYPRLSDARQKRILPLRPAALGIMPPRPQPVDPLHLEIRGELRERIRLVLDRWGYAGRDQKRVGGFLSDSGFEIAGRSLETLCLLSRLMKVDLQLQIPFEALLERQERAGVQAGAFTGGEGPPRPACSWAQGVILQALMAYYEHSGGDPRAVEAGGRIVDWYERLLSGKFSVGSWGAGGRFGAIEPLVASAWRSKDPKALQLARRIADLNRSSGGVAWMIRGEPAREHLHSCLTTVRGFPWLYGLTAERRYLDDAIAACDRIYDQCTWANGCVAELLPPDATHCFRTDETCCTADELMLSYHLADLTGDGRFFDRGDVLYYNAIRFHQWFNGNFNTYSDPYVGLKGPDNWWCCTWWGAKALYETARHLYASSPTEVYVNGFMPSRAELSLEDGNVCIETDAKIPRSGDVRLAIIPRGVAEFLLNIRVPGWAVPRAVEVNGQPQQARPSQGYLRLRRTWRAGDRVDVHFDLPLRVVLESGHGPTPIAAGKVSLEGAAPVSARSIVIYRGPVILAQFRLQNGCDLIWAYTGDDAYLFETVASVPDQFTVQGKEFRHSGTPDLVEVAHTPRGVRLDWKWRTGPRSDWTVRRSAMVNSCIPLEIQYAADIVPPAAAPADQIEEVVRTGRFCGTRMQYSVSEPSTYFDKVGHPVPPRLFLEGAVVSPTGKPWHPAADADLDNGRVGYHVHSASHRLEASDHPSAGYSAIYGLVGRDNGRFTVNCRLRTPIRTGYGN